MRKFIVFGISLLACVLAYGAEKSVSVYTQRPVDNEAVYFTPDNYNIKADGSVDVSDELQKALNEVKERYNFGIVFLPEGKYKISKTIYIPPAVRLIGYGKNRPEIFLAKNSPGFQEEVPDDKGKAGYMFWFTGGIVREGEPVPDATAGTFYSAMSNVDLRIESGNPYAVALRTHFAQHCFISHMDINIGEGKAGIFDVGNEMEDVKFYGGDYGIYTTNTSPGWQMMFVNTYFEGQRKAAIVGGEIALTIVRMHVKNSPMVIEEMPGRNDRIYLEDCILENISDAAFDLGHEGYSPNQLSMVNVVCKGVPVLLRLRDSGGTITDNSSIYRVNDFSYGLHVAQMGALPENKTYIDKEALKKMPAMPENDIKDLPDMSEWVNICDLGAVGDGVTDNTEVFKKAIEEHDVIYVPQGWYIVSESIVLKPQTCLIGLNPISTQIKLLESTPAFSGFGSPVPLLETPQGGTNIVTGIGLNTGAYNYRAVGCKWMAGEDSYMNDIKFLGIHGTMNKGPQPPRPRGGFPPRNRAVSTPEAPVTSAGPDLAWDKQYWSLWVTNGGGGVFKDIWTASTYATSGMYVSNTETRGRIYAMSVEHHVRNEVRFNKVSNWKIYALQLEEETRESPDCQPIELQDCKDLAFCNLYMFRVIRVNTPFPYAIRTWNCENIEFYNVHNFTQMRYTTNMVAYDINTRQDVRPWDITRFTVTGNEPVKESPAEKDAEVKLLATGFEFAEGMARDSKGNVYFSEERLRRVYKYDVQKQKLSLVADFPWQPLSLAVDTEDNLLVFFRYYPQPGNMIDGKPETIDELPDAVGTTFSMWGNNGFAVWVYSIDPDNPEETIEKLPRVARKDVAKVEKALYPGHRWRDNYYDCEEITLYHPDYCFVAPDGVTIVPEVYDFARSASTIEALPGKPFYSANELSHTLSKTEVGEDGMLYNLDLFATVGEGGSAVDKDGNVYVAADGYVYIFNEDGERTGIVETPERPASIVVAGENDDTLFIAARGSFYSYKIK